MIDKAILKERFVKWILVAFALSSLLFLFLIFIFIFAEGLPLFLKVGLSKIIGGFKWAPTKGSFGIFPMIVSSFLVTIGALVIGAPMGLSCAIYLSEYSGKKTQMVLKPALELLAGIPSVVYGFLGRYLHCTPREKLSRRIRFFTALNLDHSRRHDPSDHYQHLLRRPHERPENIS